MQILCNDFRTMQRLIFANSWCSLFCCFCFAFVPFPFWCSIGLGCFIALNILAHSISECQTRCQSEYQSAILQKVNIKFRHCLLATLKSAPALNYLRNVFSIFELCTRTCFSGIVPSFFTSCFPLIFHQHGIAYPFLT